MKQKTKNRKINKMCKLGSLKKINKINKFLARLIKKKIVKK